MTGSWSDADDDDIDMDGMDMDDMDMDGMDMDDMDMDMDAEEDENGITVLDPNGKPATT